jgi:hypothetical protein
MGGTLRRGPGDPSGAVKDSGADADHQGWMRVPRPGRFEVVATAFLAVTAVAAVRSAHGWTGNDFRIYGISGETMLSGAWLHAYANPLVQAGPLELGLDGTLYRLSRWPVAQALVSDLLVALLFVVAVRVFAGRKALPLAVACAGAITLGIVTNPYTLGHFAEPIAAVLWLLAARDAQRGHVLRAGVFVGISAGFEPFGILGIAVLALAPNLRAASRGAAVAVGVLALQFAPFALGGHFDMLQYRWHVTGGPLRFVIPGRTFGWPLRVVQAAITVSIAGLLIGRRVRWIGAAVFIVPAAAAIVRLSIDPMGTYYYWDTPLVIELVGMAAAIANRDAIRAWLGLRFGPFVETNAVLEV